MINKFLVKVVTILRDANYVRRYETNDDVITLRFLDQNECHVGTLKVAGIDSSIN